MIHATAYVNLPSVEIERRRNPLDRIRELFGGTVDLRSGHEAVTVSAMTLLEGLWHALGTAGVHDAISLLVDRRVVYLDRDEVTHDLDLVWEAAREKGVLEAPFHEMHLVCGHREPDLHVLLDVKVDAQVVKGTAELVVGLTGRPTALRVAPGESAEAYAERVRAFTADPGLLEGMRARVEALCEAVAEGIRAALPGSTAHAGTASVRVVRPPGSALAKMRSLGFGREVTRAQYRPTPTAARSGAYHDPYVHFWYDPYWDFTSWIVIDSMLHHHHLPTSTVHVVDAGGQELFTGATATDAGWGTDPVHVDAAGITVDDAGWGGSDTSDAGWGGSDVGSSDSSGSSCGSSCSSSSCGSSCGGGGD